MDEKSRKLVFENGREFMGIGFGAEDTYVGDVIFNTSMVGYQEIFSDSVYHGQMVCMSYPLIGNYGLTDEDYESKLARLGGLIVRDYNDSLANFRATKTLHEAMAEQGIPGITGVDTRAIVRMLAKSGAMRAVLCGAGLESSKALALLKQTTAKQNLVQQVSCKKRWYARAANHRFSVVAIDCGIQNSVVQSFTKRYCNVTVLPYNTPVQEVLALSPDGVVFSTGPGSPYDIPEVISLAKNLLGNMPVFGIGLGMQVLALAGGASVVRLQSGRYGANHPVKNLVNGKVEILGQSYGYAVDPESIKGGDFEVTHIDLIDGAVEGIACMRKMAFGVQFQPGGTELALYEMFIQMMEAKGKGGAVYA